MLQRSINYGVGDAMSEVATQPSFAAGDTLGVWRLITRQNCTNEPVPNVKEAGRPEARTAVSEALNPLLGGIMRVFDYFNSHFDGMEIENVSIVGLGAQFIGVPEILGGALGIVCRKAGMFQDIEVYDSDVKQKSDAYSSCIGAGFAVDGFLHEDSKAKISKEVNYTGASILVGTLSAVVALALALLAVFPYLDAKAEEEKLQKLYTTYEEGKIAYDQYMATKDFYDQVVVGVSLSQHANDNLLVFLGELEQRLPYDAVIEEFSSDDKQCTMKLAVADKGTATKVIETLRDFESVKQVSVASLTEQKKQRGDDEDGLDALVLWDTYVEFSVNCTYYPVGASAAKK